MRRRQQLWLTLAAAASAEIVRLGYFGEAQPFQVACARGWFDVSGFDVVCLPQSSGGYAVAKLDDGDLDVALLGSTPAATGLARGVAMQTFYVAHMKGTSQGLLVRPDIGSPLDLHDKTIGTPFGSTAHYHMLYIQTLFPDVSFELVNCNSDCPGLYDAGDIDGAFVWGGTMENMKLLGANMLVPAQMLSDWEKTTFNTISVRDAFALAHADVVAHIAGVVSRLDADYLNEKLGLKGDDETRRWDPDSSVSSDGDEDEDGATGFLASVAAAYGDSAAPALAEREAAENGLALFEFVAADDMLSCGFLGAAQAACTGTAAALCATADFLYDIGNIASVAPTGTADVDAFYVATTTAQFLADGLDAVDVDILDADDDRDIDSILTSGDSTCAGLVDLTATTGTLTDGATTSYSDDLACEWRIASGGVVELSFDTFRVWAGDAVEVFDGTTLVAKLHGFDRDWPPLRTTGAMTVKFTTDSVTEKAFDYPLVDGWSATYDAAASSCDAAFCGAHGTCDTASGLCACEAGYGGADCSLASCLGTTTRTASTGEFRSSPTAPDRGAPYGNGVECHFVADVGTSFGYVSFTITYDVEPTFDFVDVKSGDGDGEKWARLSGDTSDTATITVPTTDGKASLVFTSDDKGRRGGFQATYVAKDAACASDADCMYGTCEGGQCACAEGYGGLQCSVAHCLDRAPVVTDARSMVMVSQAPGEPVPAEQSCTWEFQAAAGEGVRVVVETLDLEPYDSSTGKGDRVSIADGEVLAKATYELSGNSVTVTLDTDKNDVLLDNEPFDGFRATAYSVAACPVNGGDCEAQGLTCADGACYDLNGGTKRASDCACAGCDVGSYLDDSTGSCEACSVQTYQSLPRNTLNEASCVACSAGMDAPEPGASRCCPENYVLVGEECVKCDADDGNFKLKGTRCDTPATRTVATLQLEEGYFRFSPAATVVYPCPEKDNACEGWAPQTNATNVTREGPYGDRFCSAHATGPLCKLCEPGHFRTRFGDDTAGCTSCDDTGELAKQLIATLVLIAAWFGVLFGIKALRTRFHRDWFEAVAIQFVFFFVTMSRFVAIHQVELPDPLLEYMFALDFVSLDLSSVTAILGCSSTFQYFHFLLWWTLLAPALVVVVVVCAVLRGLVKVRSHLKEEGGPPAAESIRSQGARMVSDVDLKDEDLTWYERILLSVQQDLDTGLMVVFAVLTMFHSGICSAIFQTFNCSENYMIDGNQNDKTGLRYLVADYSISCSRDHASRPRSPPEYDDYYKESSAEKHAHYETYARVCLVVYAVGVPLCYFGWLYRARTKARETQAPVHDAALGFLTRTTKPEFWWFEVAALVARSLVTGMLIFADRGVSLIMSFFVIVVHRTLVLQFRPYASTGLQLVVEALMRATFSIALMAVSVVGNDPILKGQTASVVAILVFALNLSVLPFAYRAYRTESYRSVARRLRIRAPVNLDEVEELLAGAHRQSIAEVVRKCGRRTLREVFEGDLDDKGWDYFANTLLKLEGVWTEDVAAADVMQWHVRSMLYRAKAYVHSHGIAKLNARAVDTSVDAVAGPLRRSLVGDASIVGAYQKLGRPVNGQALAGIYALALRPFFFLEEEDGVGGGIMRTVSVLGMMQGGPGAGHPALLRSRSHFSARSLLRDAGKADGRPAQREARSDGVSPTSALAEKFFHAAKKVSVAGKLAQRERPRRLARFLDLAMVAHDLNHRAQARIATAARAVLGEEDGGPALVALKSFDTGDAHQPALRSKNLHAFKDEVGGPALEAQLDAAVCVETLHALSTAAFPVFRAALEKLFPPGGAGVELACDANFAIKHPARMRAKVDEYRRDDKTAWPRAERLGDCLRASVVVETAALAVAAYEALSTDGPFKVVRLKNKLAEHAKPYTLHINLRFEPPGLAAMTVEVQIVPKAIFDDQKASHRLYTIARASSYAAYRGMAEEEDDDADDDADAAGDIEDLGPMEAAVRPAKTPVGGAPWWQPWAR